jgi:hypothetical protein
MKTNTYFASGSNHPGEIDGFAAVGMNVGVVAERVAPGSEAFASLVALRGTGLRVFVDSGAFSEVVFGASGPEWPAEREITPELWAERLETYRALAAELGPQVALVAPDCVADQLRTLERLETYSSTVKALRDLGAEILVPLQKGELTLAEMDELAVEILGFDSFTRAIPMKKDATTTADLEELLLAREVPAVHLLGLGVEGARSAEVVEMIDRVAPAARISCDSVRITALVGRGGKTPRPLTAAQDEARANMAGEQWGDFEGVDWTDEIADPSSWASKGELRRVAEEANLDAAEARALVRDPAAFLADEDEDGRARWERDPLFELALDAAWTRFTVGVLEARNGRPRLVGGSVSTRRRKMEAIKAVFEN